MYSMKPGRGPSFMGGIGGIVAAVFGLIWMIVAANIGAPWPFVLFGLVFVIMAIAGAIYNFYNAGAKNRMSSIDIVTDDEEPDPLNARVGTSKRFCSGCGKKVSDVNAKFCSGCGKKLASD